MMSYNIKEPILLVNSELITDLGLSINEMVDHLKVVNKENYKMVYIYAYSLFEGAIHQLAKSICYAFPQKIFKKAINNNKLNYKDIFNDINGINKLIDDFLLKIDKKSLDNMLKEYLGIVSIDVSYDEKQLIEISRNRNVIVHNNSRKINNTHMRVARPEHEKLNFETIKSNIIYLIELLREIKIKVNDKYSEYTFKKLMDESIKYTLGNSLGDYSIFYAIREDNTITLDFAKIKILARYLSTSEKLLFSIWLQQYSESISESVDINVSSFPMIIGMDDNTINKIMYIIKFFYRFPYVFQGQKIDEL